MKKKGNKKKIIIGIIIFLLICGAISNCSDKSKTEDNNMAEVEEEAVAEEKPVLFEDDEVVNDFLVSYQELSNTEFKDFDKSRNYKCYAENSGYWFEIGDYSTNTIGVMITQTNDTADAGVEGMRDVFYYTVKTLDNTLSDDEIYEVFDNREELHYKATLNKVSIEIYPDMELSGGYSRGNIQIEKSLEE